jgi:hypothetical protein
MMLPHLNKLALCLATGTTGATSGRGVVIYGSCEILRTIGGGNAVGIHSTWPMEPKLDIWI